MKRTALVIISLVVVFGLIAAGCAKKEPAKQAEEMKPPQVKEQPVPAPAPSMEMPAQPKEQPKPEAAASPNLADEIKAFEDKDIHFAFDKFILTPEDIKILNDKVSFLNSHEDVTIRIEGNCDERGTIEYNLALGDKRAMAAKNYLVEAGIAKERISTISYGKEHPLDPGHNEKAWAKNRRDHFVVSSK